jgi:hypothetical protein
MPRDDSFTPADLIGKLDVLRGVVRSDKREGRYLVATIADALPARPYNITDGCREHHPRPAHLKHIRGAGEGRQKCAGGRHGLRFHVLRSKSGP